ncbi:MAG TPA: peptidylprolyl isomerase [Armatimonadota bacterium]|jgi:cyclophilin family peptidyl-prolyl cis-trans isomerase|nr:peptidylprolyl isomerase [Armatimonadota bacterium]
MTLRALSATALLLLTTALIAIGCRSVPGTTTKVAAPAPKRAAEPAPDPVDEPAPVADVAPEADEPEPAENPEEAEEATNLLVKTTKGDIKIELYPDAAPKTVASFLRLVEEGYYDDMVWHRVAPGFVIQTGQGAERPGVDDEVNEHKHGPGAVAMAKLGSMTPGRMSQPGSATSQWYICMKSEKESAYLNAEYTVFGWATDGMDVVRQITQEDKVITIEVDDD